MVTLIPAPPEILLMETREASPAHFLIKIESFFLLHTRGIDKYETKEFVAGEYKWRLIIYPDGDKIGKDCGHVSVHLAMANMTSLPPNWEVNVVFNIFLFNQIFANYSSMGITRRFLAMKSEWGFSKFISKEIFSDPSNGYLVDDNCVFGAEVFVIRSEAITECLTLLKNIDTLYTRDWIIPNFSSLREYWSTEQFIAGDHKWTVRVYPKGNLKAAGRDVSVFLYCAGSDTPTPSERVQANYSICIKNQLDDHKHKLRSFEHWFPATDAHSNWGWPSFMEIATINDPNEGFIVNGSCLLNVEISVQAVVRKSPVST